MGQGASISVEQKEGSLLLATIKTRDTKLVSVRLNANGDTTPELAMKDIAPLS